jgi:hypothetical protein
MAKKVLCWIAAALCLQGTASSAGSQTICATTPAAAIKQVQSQSLPQANANKGYRVTSIHWDPVLRQSWATVARCDHPEWPEISVRAEQVSTGSDRAVQSIDQVMDKSSISAPVIVHAGDIVRLWKEEDLMRIEATGVAEESGGIGRRIRVRLRRRNTDDQSREEEFTGIVRGPSNVEMKP